MTKEKKPVTLGDLQEFCNVLVRAVESIAQEPTPLIDTKQFWLDVPHDAAAEAASLAVQRCRQAMDTIRGMANLTQPTNGKH